MHINLKRILLGIIILITAYAVTSFSALPTVTYAQIGGVVGVSANTLVSQTSETDLTLSRPPGSPIALSISPEIVIPSTPPLGSLAVIAWNNLDVSAEQSVFSHLLLLPTREVVWVQTPPGDEDQRLLTNNLNIDYRAPQETSQEVYLTLNRNHNDSYNQAFVHAGLIVNCVVCHMQRPEQTKSHLRGD